MRLFLAHHACASFVTAPTRITLVLGQTGLATARATSVILSVRVSVQRHTNQELVRATIGALVLVCPPLGNSRTRSYHAIGRYSIHMGPACACDRHMCACMQVFLTFAPVNDHVIPGDVFFTVRRYSCARAACGDDLIIYDVGIDIYPCIFHSVFPCQLHPHTYAIKNVLAEIVFCGFPRTMTMFITSHAELYLSTKFHVCQCCG